MVEKSVNNYIAARKIQTIQFGMSVFLKRNDVQDRFPLKSPEYFF